MVGGNVMPGQRRPLQRQRRGAPQDLLEWKTQVFLAKGWKSKLPAQTTMRAEMKAECDIIEESVLKPGVGPNCYAVVSEEKLDAGKEFKAYLAALRYFESADPNARRALADGLRLAAQAYIDHYETHSKRQKKQKQNIRKKEICEGTLSDLRKFDLRDQVNELGDPPWTSEVAMKAASLKTSLDVESVPPGEKGSEKLGGVHEFPAFWINKPDGNAGKQWSCLFKPATKASMNGFPAGGEAAREAAVGRMGDLVNGMTGLDFGVPDTHLIEVGVDKLPEGNLGRKVAPPTDGKYVGSAQTFAETGGELREQPRAAVEQASPESCQKMTILDMLTLNCDRHGGNLLVKDNPNGTPDLVPIDHGQTFPPNTGDGLQEITRKLGDVHCATLSLPGAHEPFDDNMKQAIAKIDPDALAAGMKRELATLAKVHPDAGGKIDDKSVAMSRRSAMFLKLAVAHDPALTPAAAQVALGQNAEDLFDETIDDDAFTNLANEVIAEMAANQEGLAEFFLLPMELQVQLTATLADNGWPLSLGQLDRKWLLRNPRLALDLARGDVKNPTKMAELEAIVGQQELARLLQSPDTTVRSLYANKDNLYGPSPQVDPQIVQAVEAMEQAFPNQKKINRNLPSLMVSSSRDWRDFQNLGGVALLETAIAALKLRGGEATKARNDFAAAYAALRDASAMNVASQAVAQTDTDVTAVQAELAYLRRVGAELPPNDPQRQDIAQFALRVIDGSAQQKKDLRDLRVAVVDAVCASRRPLIRDIKRRIQAVIDDPDPPNEEAQQDAQDDLAAFGEAMVNFNSGGVLGSTDLFNRWTQKYP